MALTFLAPAHADTVHLRSGEKVIGEIITDERAKIVIKSPVLGRLEILRERIERIEFGAAPADSVKTVPTPTNPPPAIVTSTNALAGPLKLSQPSPAQDDATADWIQLKSGEWLRGKMHGMQNRNMEFESDELDDLKFDWKDVHQVHMPKALVAYGDREAAWGAVRVDRENVTVTGAKEVSFSRYDLVGIAAGSPRELDYWSGRFDLGLNLRSGNTEQIDLVSKLKLERRTAKTHFKFEYLGNFSELDGVTSVDNRRANEIFDYFLTRRFFLRVPHSEYYRDTFQNIDQRFAVGGGVGYYLIDEPKVEWLVSGGPAYQYTRFDTVEPGEAPDSSTPAFVLQSSLDTELTKRIDLEIGYQAVVANEASGRLVHHAVFTVEIDLTRRLDLDISFILDRTEVPQADASGVEPKKNDARLNLSLGVKF